MTGELELAVFRYQPDLLDERALPVHLLDEGLGGGAGWLVVSDPSGGVVSCELTGVDIRNSDRASTLLEAAGASLRTVPMALTGHANSRLSNFCRAGSGGGSNRGHATNFVEPSYEHRFNQSRSRLEVSRVHIILTLQPREPLLGAQPRRLFQGRQNAWRGAASPRRQSAPCS